MGRKSNGQKNAEEFLNNLEKKMPELRKNWVGFLATSIKKDIESAMWKIVDEHFYNDYDPIYYHRNYNLYNAIGVKITQNSKTGSAKIVCSFDSSRMQDGLYLADLDFVFEITLEKGIHGKSTSPAKVSKPPVSDVFAKYIDKYKISPVILDKALQQAWKRTYNYSPF